MKKMNFLLTIALLCWKESRSEVVYKIGDFVSSKKEFYRNIITGIKKDHFSVCTSETTCSLILDENEIWTSSVLNTALAYSSPEYNKTLICGFVTKILSIEDDKVVERETDPSRIFKCVFTLGDDWICMNGNSGQYFVYNIQQEKSVVVFDNSILGSLEQISDKNCALVGAKKIICVTISEKSNVMFDLSLESAGGLAQYQGNFSFPDGEIAGFSSYGGYLMAYSVSPLEIKIGNFETGEMKIDWKNTQSFGLGISRASLKMGIILLPNGADTAVLKVFNGDEISRLQTVQGFNFNEKDSQFYYINQTTNFYSLSQLSITGTISNCKDFLPGIEECLECQSTHELKKQNGRGLECQIIDTTTNETNTNNNITNSTNATLGNNETYFLNNEYILDFSGAETLAWVKITNLIYKTEEERVEIFQNFFGKNLSNVANVTHLNDSTWNMSDFMEIEAVNNSAAWRNGELPLRIKYKRSFEKFEGNFTLHKNQSRLRILQKYSENNTMFFPSYWIPRWNFKIFFRILFDFGKILINLLQIFLIFLRPLTKKFDDKIFECFSQVIISYQIFLAFGGISGRFGGVVDGVQEQQLNSLQRMFLINPQIDFSPEFSTQVQSIFFAKFQIFNYLPSVLIENFFQILLTFFGLVISVVAKIIPELKKFSEKFEYGSFSSFISPITVTTSLSFFVILGGGITEIFGTFSIIASILSMVYYIVKFFNKNFREFLIEFLVCIFIGFFATVNVASCAMIVILYGVKIGFFVKKMKKFKFDFENSKVGSLVFGVIDSVLKIFLALFLLLLYFLIYSFDLMMLQIFSFLFIVLLLMDYIVIFSELVWKIWVVFFKKKSKKKGILKKRNIDGRRHKEEIYTEEEVINAEVGEERMQTEKIYTYQGKDYDEENRKKFNEKSETKFQNLSEKKEVRFERQRNPTIEFSRPVENSGKYVSRGTLTDS